MRSPTSDFDANTVPLRLRITQCSPPRRRLRHCTGPGIVHGRCNQNPQSERHDNVAGPIALVLSGGGARGAYEAGVLSYLFEDLPARLGRPVRFDIVTGTSVGAVHACYVAAAQHDPDAGQRLPRHLAFVITQPRLRRRRPSTSSAFPGNSWVSAARPGPCRRRGSRTHARAVRYELARVDRSETFRGAACAPTSRGGPCTRWRSRPPRSPPAVPWCSSTITARPCRSGPAIRSSSHVRADRPGTRAGVGRDSAHLPRHSH